MKLKKAKPNLPEGEPEKTKSNSCRAELEPKKTGELREKIRQCALE